MTNTQRRFLQRVRDRLDELIATPQVLKDSQLVVVLDDMARALKIIAGQLND